MKRRRTLLLVLVCALCASVPGRSDAPDEHAEARAALLAELRAYGREEAGPEGFAERVLEVLAEVPRHEFVPAPQRRYAWRNRPLPIGHGQTISQPYIVALMTDLVDPQAGDVILEVGTGSGYQAAILARLAARVHTIEIIEPLYREAAARLRRLGFDNVDVRLGDGYYGWEAHAPFDKIVVTAAASHVPPPLIAQLKPGGRMVIPVGGRFQTQQLLQIDKTAEGEIRTRQVAAVRFVPLTGER